jgi:hypothetical protein
LKAQLIKDGVDVKDSDIEVVSGGKTNLVEKTEKESRANRRTEIVLEETATEPAPGSQAAAAPPPSQAPASPPAGTSQQAQNKKSGPGASHRMGVLG